MTSNYALGHFWININVLILNLLFKCTYFIITILQFKKQNHLPPEWKLENLFIAAFSLTWQTNAQKNLKLHVLPSWLCSAAELTRYAPLYAYWASSIKIDLCLLFKQWIIHLNASNWPGWVLLLFPMYLPSRSLILYTVYLQIWWN